LEHEVIELVAGRPLFQRLEKEWFTTLERLLNKQTLTNPTPAVHDGDPRLRRAVEMV